MSQLLRRSQWMTGPTVLALLCKAVIGPLMQAVSAACLPMLLSLTPSASVLQDEQVAPVLPG